MKKIITLIIQVAFVIYVVAGFTIGILHAEKVIEGQKWFWSFTMPYFAGRGAGYGFFIYAAIVFILVLSCRLFNYVVLLRHERKQNNLGA